MIEAMPQKMKKFLGKNVNRKTPRENISARILRKYGRPENFQSERKLGDRSYCTCQRCMNAQPRWVQSASFNQNYGGEFMPGIKLLSPGVSCASNALASIVYHSIKPASEWDRQDMNMILYAGDRLHVTNLEELCYTENSMIFLEDLIRTVDLFGRKLSLQDSTFPMGGNIFMVMEDFPQIDKIIYDLRVNGANGIVMRYLMYCIAFFVEGQRIFMFDSHARDKNGMVSRKGLSSLYEFEKAEHVIPYLQRFITTHQQDLEPDDESFEFIYVYTTRL